MIFRRVANDEKEKVNGLLNEYASRVVRGYLNIYLISFLLRTVRFELDKMSCDYIHTLVSVSMFYRAISSKPDFLLKPIFGRGGGDGDLSSHRSLVTLLISNSFREVGY